MKQHKFKTWFPKLKLMSAPWDLDDRNIPDVQQEDKFCRESTECCIDRQYTGCKDKNRKDIYDGDIIKLGDTDCFYVEFHLGAYLLCWKDVNFIHRDKVLAEFTSREMEIVGNIYENPELVDASLKG